MAYASVSSGTTIFKTEGSRFSIDLDILNITYASVRYSVYTVNGTAISGADYQGSSAMGGASFSYLPAGSHSFDFDFSNINNEIVDGDRSFDIAFSVAGVTFMGGESLQTVHVIIKDDDALRNGTDLAETINGANGTDIIHGLGGADALFGFAGNDRLFGEAGNDTLDGGTG